MSGTSEQIVILYRMGNSPKEIAEMLSLQETDVLVILNSRELLTEKNISRYQKVANPIEKLFPLENDKPSVEVEENNTPKTAAEIYQDAQTEVAKVICELARSEIDQDLPASVKLKAAIYVQEEATGRNEARAKKVNNALLLNVGEFMQQIKLANSQVDRALGNVNSLETSAIEI